MNKVIITSEQNPKIKRIKDLLKKKAARKKEKCFVVEGIRAIQEIPATQCIQTLVVSEKIDPILYEKVQAKECLIVPDILFQNISETVHAQGILAVLKMMDQSLEKLMTQKGTYLILENLQDPGNLGTIIRTAHAFHFNAILMTKGCVDLYSPKVVRSTMSSLFYMPILIDQDIDEVIAFLKKQDITLYTTALTEQSELIHQVKFQKPMALIIGNEGNGVSENCLKAADKIIKIPMPGGAESLNASVAAGICMYEVMKGTIQ